MIIPPIPLQNSDFTLNATGIAGFFGGDEAVSAMASVHMYEGRKWLGWYNSPGSYVVAKRYGQLANSRFWDGLFPGVNVDPADQNITEHIRVLSCSRQVTWHIYLSQNVRSWPGR
ncbi:hypothetical protein SERLADRAFT_367532 [Serpula lacrymans var. lacrymans S7.9]|uniref:Uncharacterized protein n=1 Tax=Serpula lacrymans var. lacrymans (strain S7.9) TaxID=578457 RepID=F8NN34_SERL9|nr:uncharacterized protein SERLADRAFT_367532 [Serpula lacrymans var. lacrymans S7.9]EGO27955.1 hypothetical protein SERLADRAFT_367532 [Serpula lacrymans var. lacrymans S7.9]